jgi:hypothetical protein
MGCPTKVQLIKRKQSEQWYINFPAAVAQAMEFERGETVEWIVEDKESLVLRRQKVPPSAMKKNGWNDCFLQPALRQDQAGILPGAYIRARSYFGNEFSGWPGTSDRKRNALYQRPAV